jgi:septal ring factor EnvC (AmiA/AmiB activator)
MLRRHQVKHPASSEERIAERIDEIRAKAEALGSSERARMERMARQADTANHVTDWLTSPGLRPPD